MERGQYIWVIHEINFGNSEENVNDWLAECDSNSNCKHRN